MEIKDECQLYIDIINVLCETLPDRSLARARLSEMLTSHSGSPDTQALLGYWIERLE